jgi:hypothetical protein
MLGLEVSGNVSRGFTDNLNVAFDCAAQKTVGVVVIKVLPKRNCRIAIDASSISHRYEMSLLSGRIDHLMLSEYLVFAEGITQSIFLHQVNISTKKPLQLHTHIK